MTWPQVFHFSGTNTTADRVYRRSPVYYVLPVSQIGPVGFGAAFGLAVDPAGGLYAADISFNRVLHFSVGSTTADRVYGQNGSFTTSNPGQGKAGLAAPRDVAVDPAGGVYVAEPGNNRVLHFTGNSTTADRVYGQNGSFTTRAQGTDARSLFMPAGVAADPIGGLYVADGANHRVLHFTGSSTTADRVYGQNGSFTTHAQGTGAAGLQAPDAVAVDPVSGLYVADLGNRRVLHFSGSSTIADRVYGQDGSFTTNAVNPGDSGLAFPASVAADPAGGLYVADPHNGRVLHFTGPSTAPDRIYRGLVYGGEPNAGANVADLVSKPSPNAADNQPAAIGGTPPADAAASTAAPPSGQSQTVSCGEMILPNTQGTEAIDCDDGSGYLFNPAFGWAGPANPTDPEAGVTGPTWQTTSTGPGTQQWLDPDQQRVCQWDINALPHRVECHPAST